MNKIQRNYMASKAIYMEEKEACEEAEKKFLQDEGITSPDGKPISHVYQINWDDDLFLKICNKFGMMQKETVLKYNNSERIYHEAEKQLLDYAISKMPEYIQEKVKNLVGTNLSIRKKLINLVMDERYRRMSKEFWEIAFNIVTNKGTIS